MVGPSIPIVTFTFQLLNMKTDLAMKLHIFNNYNKRSKLKYSSNFNLSLTLEDIHFFPHVHRASTILAALRKQVSECTSLGTLSF